MEIQTLLPSWSWVIAVLWSIFCWKVEFAVYPHPKEISVHHFKMLPGG